MGILPIWRRSSAAAAFCALAALPVSAGATDIAYPAPAILPPTQVPFRPVAGYRTDCETPAQISAIYPLGSADNTRVVKVISHIELACNGLPEPNDRERERLAYIMARDFPFKVASDLAKGQLPATYQYNLLGLEMSAAFTGQRAVEDDTFMDVPMLCQIFEYRAVQQRGMLTGSGRIAVCLHEAALAALPPAFDPPEFVDPVLRRSTPAEPKAGIGSVYN